MTCDLARFAFRFGLFCEAKEALSQSNSGRFGNWLYSGRCSNAAAGMWKHCFGRVLGAFVQPYFAPISTHCMASTCQSSRHKA